MFSPTPSLLITAAVTIPAPDNDEAYGQKYGRVAGTPSLVEALSFRLGTLFINIGEKLTAHHPTPLQLNGKTA
jgi:hypothetical protein